MRISLIAHFQNNLTNEVINILRMKPKYRTDDQIKKVSVYLSNRQI